MTVTDIILIHGAWNRGACYDAVVPLLEARGYRVHAPDLTGHTPGDGGHLSVVDMEHYTRPVADILARAEGQSILLGHSMGGASISWLAQHHPDTVAGLIYLTAFLTAPGVTPETFVLPGEPNRGTPHALELIQPVDEGRGLQADFSRLERFREVFMGDYPGEGMPPAEQFIQTQSTVPFGTPNPMEGRALEIPRLYIEALDDVGIPIAVQRQMQKEFPGPVAVVSLLASHAPYYSMPERLAEAIADFADAPAEYRQTATAA
ncbi:alpha/beta fold hydrolase [Sphingomonas sp. DC2300-3]|uniref:alpha/beta fold hydrolase n=1 Tax=unclassified Sphingomonas TaxID=196159 RepID=UPI003CEBB380